MKLYLLSLTIIFLMFVSCTREIITGSGSTGNRILAVPAFTAIEIRENIRATIRNGTSCNMTASGYNNLLDILEYRVENEILKIGFRNNHTTVRNGNVELVISLPVLKGIRTYGSGEVTVYDFRSGNTIDVGLFGSGDLLLKDCSYQSADLFNYGSGYLSAKGLSVNQAAATIYGSGQLEISVLASLKASLYGSGNIYYWGSPALNIKRTGSGRVIRGY